MASDSIPPLVIFYDCCIPRKQFDQIVVPIFSLATHLHVRDVFEEKVCRNDKDLFNEIDKERQKKYAGHICILITSDGGFEEQVNRHPAYNTSVIVIKLDPSNSPEMNRKRAVEASSKIMNQYLSRALINIA